MSAEVKVLPLLIVQASSMPNTIAAESPSSTPESSKKQRTSSRMDARSAVLPEKVHLRIIRILRLKSTGHRGLLDRRGDELRH
jgi:hypothetical protein